MLKPKVAVCRYLIGQKFVGQKCFWLGVENFERRKILSVKNFVRRKILSLENFDHYFNTKVRQKSDKIVEISAWCRKFCPTKYFVRPTKLLSDEILSDKVS